jgi:nonsense-mediated mRNA decay protein 3
VSHDTKSNSYRYRHAFSVELCPVFRDDLVFLPREAALSLGGLGPLVLRVMVTNTLALLDASIHRVVHLGMKEYDRWRFEFEPVLTSRQLVEYVVLDVDPSLATGDATAARFGYRTAYALRQVPQLRAEKTAANSPESAGVTLWRQKNKCHIKWGR